MVRNAYEIIAIETALVLIIVTERLNWKQCVFWIATSDTVDLLLFTPSLNQCQMRSGQRSERMPDGDKESLNAENCFLVVSDEV